MSKLIDIKGVKTNFYTYEGVVKALDGVDLSIDHGSTFGLVGESGCGKSVTARSIMRIVQEPGKIIDGQVLFYPEGEEGEEPIDLLQQSEEYMKGLRGNQISMIFQEPNSALNPLFSIGFQVGESFLAHQKQEMRKKVLDDLHDETAKGFNVWKIVQKSLYTIVVSNENSLLLKILKRVPLLKHWENRTNKEAVRRSVELIGKLGIPNPDDVCNLYPHNLSGGMKQRIVIAIALACQPILLLADEATSNLDVTIQAQILRLINELKKTDISSVIMITHDLGVVAETCDRVGVMYAGNLCEVADVEAIFEKPKHPYTLALLDSVPKLHQTGELQTIEGNVPNLISPPGGCRFHPRCLRVMEHCKTEVPRLIEVAKGHLVACHLFTEDQKQK